MLIEDEQFGLATLCVEQIKLIGQKAIDLKPDFPDTPRDWQNQLELAFMTKSSPFSRPPEIIERPEDK